MEIQNNPIKRALQSYVRKVEGKRSAAVDATGAKPAVTRSDSVTITARSEEVRQAKEAYEKLPETRRELVDSLKERVESGTYKVTSKEVADKIVHSTIVDKLL